MFDSLGFVVDSLDSVVDRLAFVVDSLDFVVDRFGSAAYFYSKIYK